MPEHVKITERLQKIGQTSQEYKDAIIDQFKDMELDVKDWNFSVGKSEKEYVVEFHLSAPDSIILSSGVEHQRISRG